MADDASAARGAFPPPNLSIELRQAAEASRAWLESHRAGRRPHPSENPSAHAGAPCSFDFVRGGRLLMHGVDIPLREAEASLRAALSHPERLLSAAPDPSGFRLLGAPHLGGFLLVDWADRSAGNGRPAFCGWSVLGAVDGSAEWGAETAPTRIDRVVWSSEAEARRSLLDAESLAFVEAAVAEDTRELGSDEVWFHTVHLGPLVALCSLASGVLSIDALLTPEEDEEDCVPLDVEVGGKAVVVPSALAGMTSGKGKVH